MPTCPAGPLKKTATTQQVECLAPFPPRAALSRFSRSILCAGDYRSSHHKVIEIEKRVKEKRRRKKKKEKKKTKVCVTLLRFLISSFFSCCCCLVSLLFSPLSFHSRWLSLSFSLSPIVLGDGGLSSFFIVLYRGEKMGRGLPIRDAECTVRDRQRWIWTAGVINPTRFSIGLRSKKTHSITHNTTALNLKMNPFFFFLIRLLTGPGI